MFTIYEILVKYWKKILLITAGALVLIAVIKHSSTSGEKQYRSEYDTRLGAFTAATMLVKENLKSPQSAIFPTYESYMVTKEGDKLYRVTSYVDSQNSFGAMIRTDFSLLMRDDGFNWTVIDHKITNR